MRRIVVVALLAGFVAGCSGGPNLAQDQASVNNLTAQVRADRGHPERRPGDVDWRSIGELVRAPCRSVRADRLVWERGSDLFHRARRSPSFNAIGARDLRGRTRACAVG